MNKIEDLKIITLQIEGVRKITGVELEFPDSGMLEVAGLNQAGKTSIISAIEWLFRGKKALPKDAIQHGKDECKVIGELNGYVIERTAKRDGKDTLKVRKSDGGAIDITAQKFLDMLVNELTFNPMPFLDKNAASQLRDCMKLFNIDFTEIDAEIKQLEDVRRECKHKLDVLGNPIAIPKVEPVDISVIQEERNVAVKLNKLQDERQTAIDKAEALQQQLSEKKQEVIKQIQALQDELTELTERQNKGDEYIKTLPKPEKYLDLSCFDEIIASASEQNKKAYEYDRYRDDKDKAREIAVKRAQADARINKLREQKVKQLQSVNAGIPGFEIREDGLYQDGIHSESWSKSQALIIATKLAAQNKPPLSAMFLDYGSEFDFRTKDELRKWAVESGIQLLITTVDTTGMMKDAENVLYIEDGVLIK